jgi:Spy/CpxP family protein refolding chaperone
MRIITLAIALFTAVPAVAQEQHGDSAARAAQVKERLAKISRDLNLTPQQVDQLRPIVQQEVAELRALREKHKGDKSTATRKAVGQEMKEIQARYEPQISAVLTPEQQAQWKQMKEAKKGEVKKGEMKKGEGKKQKKPS